jgi:hypothetical protein
LFKELHRRVDLRVQNSDPPVSTSAELLAEKGFPIGEIRQLGHVLKEKGLSTWSNKFHARVNE